MLKIENLSVSVAEAPILKNLNLEIGDGEVCILLGPNGSGKSTLLQTIMGSGKYRIDGGGITFDGRDITNLPTNERVGLGISMSFQQPPSIMGVRLIDLLKRIDKDEKKIASLADELNMANFLHRDLNLGFSGGELKRCEMLQLLLLKPKLTLLDEPDSGVDVENLGLIGKEIETFLKEEKPRVRERSGLIITHMGSILDHVRGDRAFVMLEGKIACSGNPQELLRDIKENGYEGCVKCRTQC